MPQFFLIMPEFDCSECSERRDLRDNAIFRLFLFFAQNVSEVTCGERALVELVIKELEKGTFGETD